MDRRRGGEPVREAELARARGRPAVARGGGTSTVDPLAAVLMHLQSAAGNAAVQRLVHGSVTVQRFWPFDDEEEVAANEDGWADNEASGSIPNEEWGAGDTGADGGTGEEGYGTRIEDDDEGAGGESWLGPGGEWGGGEEQADGAGPGDWLGPGGEWGSEGGEGEGGEEGTGEGTELLSGTPEEQWDQAVADGDFDEALAIVLRTYGFGGPFIYTIWFNPNEAYAAEAGGPLGTPQWISVGYDAFNAGLAYCVSVIGHEVEHAKQRAGDLEYHAPESGEEGRPIQDEHLREFLAYSWEVLDSPVRLEGEDLRAMCNMAKGHFAFLGGYWQEVHRDRYNRVLAAERAIGESQP